MVSITLLVVLNALSEATIDIGIAKMSLATIDKMGYMTALSFHLLKRSNVALFFHTDQ
jgi:hypothetical protein